MTVYFLHASNILWMICFGLRDVLLLRILAVTAILVVLPYYFFPPELDSSKWAPIFWQTLFMLINVVWILQILKERRPPRMTPEERKLYEFTFRDSCTPRELLQLLSVGKWYDAEPNEYLIRQGTTADRLVVIGQGQASIHSKQNEKAKLSDGDVIGAVSYLTREPSVADVVASGPLRYVAWDRAALEELYKQRIGLKSAIQGIIGHNLVDRLNKSIPSVPALSLNTRPNG